MAEDPHPVAPRQRVPQRIDRSMVELMRSARKLHPLANDLPSLLSTPGAAVFIAVKCTINAAVFIAVKCTIDGWRQ